MEGIIDFHTHAFPDALAQRAMGVLEAEADVKGHLDGTLKSLLGSMDSCGIQSSVVCSIATRPGQFDSILDWSRDISTERIIPFPSVHPEDPELKEHIRAVKKAGFKGIKLHPFYQEFHMDEERIDPLYETAGEEGLIIVMHTGYDIAFPAWRLADPAKIVKVARRFPSLKLVTTHLGSWKQWEEVEAQITGKEIYMEISFALDFIDKQRARRMILEHPPGHVLFGTDSPWTGQPETLGLLRALELGPDAEERILRENALALLGSV